MARTFARSRTRAPYIGYTIEVWKENGAYVAHTPELDVSSCGDSTTQAKARLREAVNLFLEEASRMGTLKDILTESGFERKGGAYLLHRVIVKERIRLALPVVP